MWCNILVSFFLITAAWALVSLAVLSPVSKNALACHARGALPHPRPQQALSLPHSSKEKPHAPIHTIWFAPQGQSFMKCPFPSLPPVASPIFPVKLCAYTSISSWIVEAMTRPSISGLLIVKGKNAVKTNGSNRSIN